MFSQKNISFPSMFFFPLIRRTRTKFVIKSNILWAFSLDTLFVWGIDLHQFVSAVLKMRWNIWHFIKLVSIWYVWTSKWWHLFACRGKRDIYIVPKKDNIHSVDLISFPNNPKCILINKKKGLFIMFQSLNWLEHFV